MNNEKKTLTAKESKKVSGGMIITWDIKECPRCKKSKFVRNYGGMCIDCLHETNFDEKNKDVMLGSIQGPNILK